MKLREWWSDKFRRGLVLLAAAAVVAAVTGREFVAQRTPFPVKRGPGVAVVWRLSDFLPNLKDTRGDTELTCPEAIGLVHPVHTILRFAPPPDAGDQ